MRKSLVGIGGNGGHGREGRTLQILHFLLRSRLDWERLCELSPVVVLFLSPPDAAAREVVENKASRKKVANTANDRKGYIA